MTTAIEWTDVTLNPTTGCDRVSPGCDNCYALTMAKRLKAMGQPKYQNDGDPRTSGPGFGITEHSDTLTEPLRWRTPRKVFVNSMSDLFHKGVSDKFIAQMWAVMASTPQHSYQILTKRHDRMRSLLSAPWFKELVCSMSGRDGVPEVLWQSLPWPLPNVWLGVSVEDQKRADLRIPHLLDTPAAVRFLSCEPLIGPVDLYQTLLTVDIEWCGIDWCIVGGESGSGARPMHPAWARSLRDQCETAQIPFLFKQRGAWTWDAPGREVRGEKYVKRDDGRIGSVEEALADGGEWQGVWNVGKHAAGRNLDGQTYDQYPKTKESI